MTTDPSSGSRGRSAPVEGALLDRRAAALVALLALEGPSSRSRLAGLLWPDVPEQTARNNLSQTLRRLRRTSRYQIVGDTHLTLGSPIGEQAAQALLAVHDYADLTDLSDLLLTRRDRLQNARLRALRTDLRQAEEAGRYQEALDLSAVVLDLDPLHEATYRSVMRISHLLGDRSGALATYHRCRRLLLDELDVHPAAETQQLAREIEHSGDVPRPNPAALPLSVQRPPRLIGRDAAWTAMAQAWAEGKGIILSGEPGIGKTRLLRDFVAAHGRAIFFEGRPGDRLVPYSTHARAYSGLLRQLPGLPLPIWVRRELARTVPDMGELPSPMSTDAERLRFYQAHTETLRLAAEAGLGIVALDDLQFMDDASVEAGEHALSNFWGEGDASIRTIHSYRSGELSEALEHRIDVLVSAGLAVRVHLQPLTPAQAGELIASLHLEDLRGRLSGIAGAAGGNPLLLLESARHLLTSEEGRTVPPHVATQLGQRLERLSPAALNLARVASVLGPDLSAEAAATMMGLEPLALGAAWTELEATQVLIGTAFTHDLLSEAVLERMPQVLRALLHRQAAAALESGLAAPARIAEHWSAGGDDPRAAPWWQRAGDEAQQQYRALEAAERYERAWRTYDDPSEAFEAGLKLARLLCDSGDGERAQAVVASLLGVAGTPAQRASVQVVCCQLIALKGEGQALEAAARQGLLWCRAAADQHAELELLSYLGSGLFFQHRLEEALDVFRASAGLAEQVRNISEWCIALSNESAVLGYLGRRTEAVAPLRRAEQLMSQTGRPEQRADILLNLGNVDLFCGRVEQAHQSFEQAQHLLDQVEGAAQEKRVCLLNRVGCARLLGRYAEALRLTEQALTLDRDGSFLRAVFLKERARLYLLMGADALARTSLAQIQTEGQGRLPEVGRIGVSLLQALLAVRQGQSVEARLADLTRELGALASPLDDRVAVALVFAPLLSPGQSLDLTAPLIEETRQAELFGLRLGLLVGRVPAHLALGQLAEAQVAMAEVLSAPAELRPACTRADVLFAHARLLAALRDPAAGPKLEAAQSALLRMAEDEVPSEHRSSFLSLPAHQRLLTFHAGPRAWQPLTDAQWAAVLPLLQRKDAGTGRPRRDTRAVLDGVLWALATGAPWNRPFPGHLPSAATCYRRYREWQASGALTEVQAHLSGLVTGHPPTF